jgi:hypothetical protein
MRRRHNATKEDENFQRSGGRKEFQFASGASWMVCTDTVPHARSRRPIRSGANISRKIQPPPERPESGPLAVLETMSGARLVEAGLRARRPVGVRQI